ncbi:uncharacterized protein [Spinacia oleracea]|uniref:Ternary complex factor MIP1 leucine-zipper domain-containing protein n=1 Tax=Spinacia oleracea TaxID=3562 RepID=A0ABM3R2F9_SPIOL|nr:uncharacterized protein LOC130464308 [Spinacia oleracea]
MARSFSSNSMPSLISRLDYLDSKINYLEGRKCSSARWTGDGALVGGVVNRECVPLDLAVMEAQSKGSLLDRIASLEDRLIQVCLHIESEAASSSNNSESEQTTTSPRVSRKGFSNSFSRFRLPHRSNNQPISPIFIDKFPITEGEKHVCNPECGIGATQGKKSKKVKDDKSSPKRKKFVTSSLLHLRLLGC